MTENGVKADGFEVRRDDKGNFYVYDQALMGRIVQNVYEGKCTVILGPGFSNKTQLLKDTGIVLAAEPAITCVYCDLEHPFSLPDGELPAHFAALVLHELGKVFDARTLRPPEVSDEESLRQFLLACRDLCEKDLVLLIDHLEAVRIGAIVPLLRVLRSIWMDQPDEAPHRLSVVAASALTVADLSLGRTSPFNFAETEWIHDLSPKRSDALIRRYFQQSNLRISRSAILRIYGITNGDQYMLQAFCQHCIGLRAHGSTQPVTASEVGAAVTAFYRAWAPRYRPLHEAVQALEADADSLIACLKTLERASISGAELGLSLQGPERLLLTGAVVSKTRSGVNHYRVRNKLYKRHIQKHFDLERVVTVLTLGARWSDAIQYVRQHTKHGRHERLIVVRTIRDAIYASAHEAEAYHYLHQFLANAFELASFRIYKLAFNRTRLEPLNANGKPDPAGRPLSLRTDQQRPEVMALIEGRDHVYRVAGKPLLVIPILQRGNQLGVVVVEAQATRRDGDTFQELVSAISRIGAAIGEIAEREHKLRQVEELNQTGQHITGLFDLPQALQATVQAAVNILEGSRAVLYLWSEHTQHLRIAAQQGYSEAFVREVQIPRGVGIAGQVYDTGRPKFVDGRTPNAQIAYVLHPEVRQARSAIFVPVIARGQTIGALGVDHVLLDRAFRDSDVPILSTLGAQAAIVIQNARLNQEFSELGSKIHSEDMSKNRIFAEFVKSIIRVTGAGAASMIWFDHEFDPAVEPMSEPAFNISYGLGDDYEQKVIVRQHGMTARALQTGEFVLVNKPSDPPGINPLAQERGVQASMCVPLLNKGRAVGVFFVHHFKEHEFTANDCAGMSLYAKQALAIIDQWQGERRLEQERMNALRQTSQMVAHRLRNVLPVVDSRIASALRGGYVRGRGVAHCETAQTETRRALRIVQDFEKFSKAERSPLSDRVSGNQLLNELRAEALEHLRETDAGFEQNPPPNLPSVQTNLALMRDDFAVLVLDSLRHRPSGLVITLAADFVVEAPFRANGLAGASGYLRLIYSDNGPGVPAAHKQRIFEPFFTTTGGSGLGLAIVQQHAQMQGGQILETGNSGQGVRFELFLPVAQGETKES